MVLVHLSYGLEEKILFRSMLRLLNLLKTVGDYSIWFAQSWLEWQRFLEKFYNDRSGCLKKSKIYLGPFRCKIELLLVYVIKGRFLGYHKVS